MKIERYGIYWVDLNPVIGAELAKIRPAVVISDDLMNRHLKTVVICPITSTLHPAWRSRIVIECAGRAGEIAVDQIRTVSRQRLRQRIDQIEDADAEELRRLIVEMYGVA
jgi:mRNA interferase MazF